MIALSLTADRAPLATPAECATLLLPRDKHVGVGPQRVAIAAIGYDELLYLARTAVVGGAQAVTIPDLPELLYTAARQAWPRAQAVVELTIHDTTYYLRLLPTRLRLDGGAAVWVERSFLNLAHSHGSPLVVGRSAAVRLYAWGAEPRAEVCLLYAEGARVACHTAHLAALTAGAWPSEVRAWATDYHTMRQLLPQAAARLIGWRVRVGGREAFFALAPEGWCESALRFDNHLGLPEVASLLGGRAHHTLVAHEEAIVGGERLATATDTTAKLVLTTLPLGVASALAAEEVARSPRLEDTASGTPLRYTEGAMERSASAAMATSYTLQFTHTQGAAASAPRGLFAPPWGATYH